MKVIWLCNFPLPEIAKKLDMKETVNEGWIQGLSNGMKLRDDVEIIYLFISSNKREKDVEWELERNQILWFL